MSGKTLERLRAELEAWRRRLDRMRVRANLGRKDARDKLRELEARMEPAFERAARRLDTIAETGSAEARKLVRSLRAGWKEVRRTHRELSREAGRARPNPGKKAGV